MAHAVLLGEGAHAHHLVGQLEHQPAETMSEAVQQGEGRCH